MTLALTLPQLTNPATADQWNTAMLGVAARIGLPTTTWQQGGIERSVFAVVANIEQEQDVSASIISQAGFLKFAAQGFVTYVDLTGATVTLFVTPDPSIPAQNPTGALGWLDVLADGVYDVQRILATFAGGVECLLNLSASTYGPFAAGTFHVGQPNAPGAPSYSNTASLTIPPSGQVGGSTGLSSVTNMSGLIAIIPNAAHGLTTGAYVYVTGVTGLTGAGANGAWRITVVDASTFTLDGSLYIGTWGGTGNVYVPTTGTFTADVRGSGANAEGSNLVTTPITSLIGVSVANVGTWLGSDVEGNVALADRCLLKLSAISTGGPKGAYLYFAFTAQQLAPGLTPPQVVGVNITRANVVLDSTTGTVITTIANAAGPPSAQDVAAVAAVIQANAVTFDATSLVQAATERDVAVVVTVYLPSAFNTVANTTIAQVAVQLYFQTVPIGGVTDPGGQANVLPIEEVRNAVQVALAAAGVPVQDLIVTLDGGSGAAVANVQLLLTPTPEVAVLTPSPATVNLVSV